MKCDRWMIENVDYDWVFFFFFRYNQFTLNRLKIYPLKITSESIEEESDTSSCRHFMIWLYEYTNSVLLKGEAIT